MTFDRQNSQTVEMVKKSNIIDSLLYLTIFSVPFGTFSIKTGLTNLSLPNILIVITLVTFAITRYRKQRLYLSRLQLIALGMLCVLILIQSITTFIHSGSSRRIVTYIGYMLFTIGIFTYVDSYSDARRLLQAAFLSAVVLSILTIVHVFLYPQGLPFGDKYRGQRAIFGVTIPFQRTLGLDITYGAFGMYTMMATPYYIYKNLKKPSLIEGLGILLVLLAVLISQSRSTWVAAGVAIFIVITGYGVYNKFRIEKNNTYMKIVSYGILVAGLILILLSPGIIKEIISVRSDTFFSRIEQYQSGIEIVLSEPLIGVGFGTLEELYQSGSAVIHSSFVNLAAQTGLIGLALVIYLWLIVILVLMKEMFYSQLENTLAIGIFASLAAIFIETNLQPGFTKAPWIVLALALSVYTATGIGRTKGAEE